ncbi:hypothetical protein HMPREF9554_02147 [Treponema phagedenis F0421]|nr:hypothetical protein HMPREF9554_02147 [Treponema phagedenis F0421]
MAIFTAKRSCFTCPKNCKKKQKKTNSHAQPRINDFYSLKYVCLIFSYASSVSAKKLGESFKDFLV